MIKHPTKVWFQPVDSFHCPKCDPMVCWDDTHITASICDLIKNPVVITSDDYDGEVKQILVTMNEEILVGEWEVVGREWHTVTDGIYIKTQFTLLVRKVS